MESEQSLNSRLKKLEFGEIAAIFSLVYYDYFESEPDKTNKNQTMVKKTEKKSSKSEDDSYEESKSLSESEDSLSGESVSTHKSNSAKSKHDGKIIKKKKSDIWPITHDKMSKYVSSQLRIYYDKNKYPSDKEKKFLAKKYDIPLHKIKSWYRNNRSRDKRKNL